MKEPMNPDITMKVLISALFIIPILFLLMILYAKDNNSVMSCEDIGGTYQVIGEEFSPAVKRTIDIYGCVK